MVDGSDADCTPIDLTINYKLTAIDFLFQCAKVRLIILTINLNSFLRNLKTVFPFRGEHRSGFSYRIQKFLGSSFCYANRELPLQKFLRKL